MGDLEVAELRTHERTACMNILIEQNEDTYALSWDDSTSPWEIQVFLRQVADDLDQYMDEHYAQICQSTRLQ